MTNSGVEEPAFFRIDTIGDLDSEELCFVDGVARGLGPKYYRMAVGKTIAHEYADDVTLALEDSSPGLKCATLLGNTQSYLILLRPAKEVVESLCGSEGFEYLPVDLINHKGRLHNSDYFFINPIGDHDCLDLEESEILYSKKAKDPNDPSRFRVIRVVRPVIDAKKAALAPPLFRLREEPRVYVVNGALGAALAADGFENIMLRPLPVSGVADD